MFPPSTDEDGSESDDSLSENEDDDYVPNDDEDSEQGGVSDTEPADEDEDDDDEEKETGDEDDDDEDKEVSGEEDEEDETKGGAGGTSKKRTGDRRSKKRQKEKEQDDEELRQDMFERLKRLEMDTLILDQHPEVLSETMEEVKARCVITYDANGMIKDDQHKTTPILTKYEWTRVLGQRTKQLNGGAPCLLEGGRPNIIDNLQIAQQELAAKKLPFIIRRPLPGGKFEYWRLQDLQLVL